MIKLKSRKTFNTILFLVLSLLISFNSANAKNNCNYRAFNIKVLDGATTNELLNQLSVDCGFSILIKDKIAKKQINKKLNGINIHNMSLNEIFGILLNDNNLKYDFNNNILKISGIETKTFKIDYITSDRIGTAVLNASVQSTNTNDNTGATDENQITTSESFNFWKDISKDILSIANSGSEDYIVKTPIVNQNAGLITVTGTKAQIDRVDRYLQDIKKRLNKEVLIDVSIVSVELGKAHTSGVDWTQFALALNKPTGSSVPALNGVTNGANTGTFTANGDRLFNLAWNNAFSFTNTISFTMNGLMNFLKTQGHSRIVSNPKILTLNNQQALITIGDNINYRVPETTPANTGGTINVQSYTNESIFVGILLNIMPQISENDEIMLRINPSISNFKYAEDNIKQTQPREIAPDTTEKKLSTVVRVKNGDTIILGGLIGKSNNISNTGVSGLKELPILGNLFKSKSMSNSVSELIFIITPRIVKNENHSNISLKELGYGNTTIGK